MVVGPYIVTFVIGKGIVPSRHVVQLHIKHPNLGKLGIVSIYAPNGKCRCAGLWHELANPLDSKQNWIVVNDYNTVEDVKDCRGGSRKIVDGGERRAWRRLKRKLCLEDTITFTSGHLTVDLGGTIEGNTDTILMSKALLI